MNYEIFGDGDPLLLLHGWGGEINSMLPIINTYKERYKVIVVDFPGHGKSDLAPSWNVTDYMEYIHSFINSLGINDLIVLGHSFGGRVGILLSATYPKLVKKLILVDSGGIIPKRSLKYYFKLYSYKFAKHFMKLVIRDKEKYEYYIEEKRRKRSSNDFNALKPEMRSTFIKVVNQNLKPYLKKITCPTLIIFGEFDEDTPVYMGKILHKGIKNSVFYVFENCGHFAYLDDFVEFKKKMDSFLDK